MQKWSQYDMMTEFLLILLCTIIFELVFSLFFFFFCGQTFLKLFFFSSFRLSLPSFFFLFFFLYYRLSDMDNTLDFSFFSSTETKEDNFAFTGGVFSSGDPQIQTQFDVQEAFTQTQDHLQSVEFFLM